MVKLIDITGQTFGRWLVLSKVHRSPNWLCKCKCGTVKEVNGSSLRSGMSKSCGCIVKETSNVKYILGQKFGRLEVTSFYKRDKEKNATYWECRCDCGNIGVYRSNQLVSGKTKSCGCLVSEVARDTMIKLNTKHSMYGTKEYRAWRGIMSRIYNPNTTSYDLYGGIGLPLEDEFNTFEGFYAEVGPAPLEGRNCSIDRIDNTKGYIKGNIRWASQTTQNRNRGSFKNNKTGVIGVMLLVDRRRKSLTYCAKWHEYVDGVSKRYTKSFSVRKYGLLPAFAMACKYREDQIKRLNELGYGYSENHGKEKKIAV